jgi:antitoxin component YwqK of YwqJK toxin-antitoxin module
MDLLEEGIFFSGRDREGEFMAWHPNGRVFVRCQYRGGKQHGEYLEWNERGALAMHLIYRDGKRIRILR